MKIFDNPKQKKQAVYLFLILAAAVTYALTLTNLSPIFTALRRFLLLFIPFYIGLTLAYLLNPILKSIEKGIFKKIKKARLRRILSVLVIYIVLVAFLIAICAFVLPNLVSSVVNLISNFQSYYDMFTQYLENLALRHPSLNEYYTRYSSDIKNVLYNVLSSFTDYLSKSLPQILKFTGKLSETLINIFLGFIISIYFLIYKERISARWKRSIAAIFSDSAAKKVFDIIKVTDIKTGKFIIGRIIDSLIMTVLCFIFMSLFRFPYPLLNCIIIGVFNLIPVFGSIVSAIPTSLIVLITKPSAFIYFLIFIIIIQQFDGNVLGPKIQGDQLGISALWIMFAVLLFGGLFGVVGMIIGVPLFSVIYYFVDEAIEMELIRKKKPSKASDYID